MGGLILQSIVGRIQLIETTDACIGGFSVFGQVTARNHRRCQS
jgi:hypothetical protein